jgi:hypothetical protein
MLGLRGGMQKGGCLNFTEIRCEKGAKITINDLKYFQSKLKKRSESNINKNSAQKRESL